MLISSYAPLSSLTCADMAASGVGLGDARHELIDEHAHIGADFTDTATQVVVAEQARDGDAEAGDGRYQGRRDAGRDSVDVHIPRGGNGGEGDHDADHGAEQS